MVHVKLSVILKVRFPRNIRQSHPKFIERLEEFGAAVDSSFHWEEMKVRSRTMQVNRSSHAFLHSFKITSQFSAKVIPNSLRPTDEFHSTLEKIAIHTKRR